MHPYDPTRAAMLEDRVLSYAETDERWLEFVFALLMFGGYYVAPVPEPDLTDLLARGEVFTGYPFTEMYEGVACECHGNTARLWELNEVDYIVTGWALSGGCWRQHSWGLDEYGIVTETTEKRDLYFGYVLTPEEAREFVEFNPDPLLV